MKQHQYREDSGWVKSTSTEACLSVYYFLQRDEMEGWGGGLSFSKTRAKPGTLLVLYIKEGRVCVCEVIRGWRLNG